MYKTKRVSVSEKHLPVQDEEKGIAPLFQNGLMMVLTRGRGFSEDQYFYN